MYLKNFSLEKGMELMHFDLPLSEAPILGHLQGALTPSSGLVITLAYMHSLFASQGLGNHLTLEQKSALLEIKGELSNLMFSSYGHVAINEGLCVDVTKRGESLVSLTETVLNAIEHGSNYCQKGNVHYELIINRFGALSVVEDPGDGFDPKHARPLSGFLDGFMRPTRGRGVKYCHNCRGIIGAERLNPGFRVSTFYGRFN